MSFLSIPSVAITGISACVPKREEFCSDFPLFSEEESLNFSKTTGVISRRVASPEMCSSDLCFHAADKLLSDMQWDREEIDCLVFVTQTPDYHLPATSPLLQKRLGLSENCLALDISLGCSGFVYGLGVITSLLSHGNIKKGLLLSGDTITKTCSKNDKTTFPLFGDAGSATALEFQGGGGDFLFNLKTDGSGSNVIKIEDGGFRNPTNYDSFKEIKIDEGISRNKLQLILEGMDVFTFGISKAPASIKELTEHFELNLESVNYFIFHQANKFMNEKIRKKLNLPAEKVPYSIERFGNTSCATIPLTMVTEMRDKLENNRLSHIACGFGVGLSWGSVYFETDKIVVSDLIEI